MDRFLVEFSYDGGEFAGLLGSGDSQSVYSLFLNALTPLKDCISLMGFAGRTDAGVHAAGQVAVIDTTQSFSVAQLLSILRRAFPPSLSISHLVPVSSSFHPRGSARYRQYSYWVSESMLPIPYRRFVAFHHRPLSDTLMEEAASKLLGFHDFSGFSCKGSHFKTPLKWVMACEVLKTKLLDYWSGATIPVYQFRMVATSFLYRMVRSIMSGILAVGDGSMALSSFLSQLAQTTRSPRLGIAPSCGLVFEKVYY